VLGQALKPIIENIITAHCLAGSDSKIVLHIAVQRIAMLCHIGVMALTYATVPQHSNSFTTKLVL